MVLRVWVGCEGIGYGVSIELGSTVPHDCY